MLIFLDLEPSTCPLAPFFLRWIWTKSARWSFTRNAPWRRRPRASVCRPHVAVVFGSPSTGHGWHGDEPCVRWRTLRHRNPAPWCFLGGEFGSSDFHLVTFVDFFFWFLFGFGLSWGCFGVGVTLFSFRLNSGNISRLNGWCFASFLPACSSWERKRQG